MKRGFGILLIFILIVSINVVSASFEIGNLSHSIGKSYGPSDYIKGWINISLENEPTGSVFEDDEDNSISLIDLLNINKDLGYDGFDDFSCIPRDCETDYSASGSELTKTFSLDKGNFTIFGFKFTGNLDSVTSIDFILESDASSSCYNQLKIDFFNDERIMIANNKVMDAPECDDVLKRYGCFDNSKATKNYTISETPYCQRIKLTESPGFKIGAWVKKETSGTKELTMELYDNSGTSIKTCELLEEISESGGETFCNINYSVSKSQDYYVCIYSDYGTGAYMIKGNKAPSIGCGFYGIPIPSETPGAYQIFAEGKRFGAIGTWEISNSLPQGEDTLGGKASDYLAETYGRKGDYIDCSAGCVVPVKFISGKNQNIIIRELEIKYVEDKGVATEYDFYDLSESIATIDAEFQKLYLDEANFSVPDDFGNYTFSLSLNDDEILSEEVSVERVPVIKNLQPRTTASAYPTEFEVTVESDGNITKYEWDFGKNDTKTTTTNKVTHTYGAKGIYELKITVTDSNQRSSYRVFEISVGSPEDIINRLLTKMQEDLTNVKAQINAFNSFLQDSLKSILDIDELDEKLTTIYRANASCSDSCNESDYNKIMTDLLKLKIPESVVITATADSFSFYPEEENINLDILKTIGGGDYDASDQDKYIDSVFAWNQENMETKITFKELSAKYEYSEEPILRTFELKITKKNETDNPYLILLKLDNLEFKEDYSEKNESGYVYIELIGNEKIIIFSTTEDVNFVNLPFFISPAISKLSITGEETEEEGKLLKLVLFILIFFLLIIIGFIAYIVLQQWYKKKYESYLFKNRNDLYNLVSYIQNSKKRGLENKDIINKLRKTGWKSEQVTYVLRKYVGKRTGMFEIPVKKILSKFKKKEIKNIPPGRPGAQAGPKTFTSRFNPKRIRKRFS